ncbi:leucine-rich repeat domain-containing protein [Streptomyces sp. enrichment culture]|uniref:leucine-rich repeat domain-containing protein n=1 Tax=Streptomyces sp. enrichment culture TaxID=1795815 RepID=UPI003F550FED
MSRPPSPGTQTGNALDHDSTKASVNRLRTLLPTTGPAEAGRRVRELMSLAASGGGREALDLAVRYSVRSDCSTAELVRWWAVADGDPYGFCDLPAPAYRARKAVRKLVELSAPGDGGHALRLAARFIPADAYASKFLVRLWRTVRDPDAFAEHLLAPAFRQEGRTELRLPYASSLRGLRHLTMLETLHFEQCGKLTDLTEVGALTRLTDLRLGGCTALEDLTPISRLSRLTRLDLSHCDRIEDFAPLLSLRHLRELSVYGTRFDSVRGFGQALTALESLDLRSCRSFTDLEGLAVLPSLTELRLSDLDRLSDLTPFAALPRLRSLGLHDCGALRSLEGLGSHPQLAKLGIHGGPELRTLEGLGEQPALRELSLTHCPALADLKGAGRLPALRTLLINGTAVRDLGDLSGSPLATLTLFYMKHLESLNALRDCPDLRQLDMTDCPLVEDIPLDQLDRLSLSGAHWTDLSRLAGPRAPRTPETGTSGPQGTAPGAPLSHLAELDLRHCRSLEDIRPLLDLPSLTHVHLAERTCSSSPGATDPVVTELRARGVTVTLHP